MFSRMLEHRLARRSAIVVTEFLTGLAVIYALCQIAVKTVLYAAGLHGPDATLYWTMGNAIRNGLVIYKDIFDPKPPGMFLLSALSFQLFGNGTLGDILNIVVLLSIPCLFVYWARPVIPSSSSRASRGASVSRGFTLQLCLILGLTFTLYNATIGGDWQTEYYGAFFGLLYLAAINAYQRRPQWLWVIAASASFSIALLLKEPFLLALTAIAILFLRTKKEWLRLWVIPVISAGTTYIVVLSALGAFWSYIGIYLQGMLGNYVLRGGPVWARGIVAWERIFTNVKDFSAWFPLLIAALFILTLPPSKSTRERWMRISGAFVAFALLLVGRSLSPVRLPWHLDTLPAVIILLLSIVIFCAVAFLSNEKRATLSSVLFPKSSVLLWRPLLALYLVFTSIGLGADFHGQYFALAIPFYAALVLLFLQRKDLRLPSILTVTALAALVLLSSTSFLRPGTLTEQMQSISAQEATDRGAAAQLDAILDACDVDRYYYLESTPLPFATHSPLNYYLYTRIEHITRYHPIFFDESTRRLEQAQIIVLNQPYVPLPRAGNEREIDIGQTVESLLRDHFTDKQWSCTEGLRAPDGYLLLFRVLD